jgi:citronellol/citronellal dehydrogenase
MSYHSIFRDAIFAGRSIVVTGACIRVDGGEPNARPTWPLLAYARSKPFDGFPLYQSPKALNPIPSGA